MYPKLLHTLAGACLLLFTACTSVYHSAGISNEQLSVTQQHQKVHHFIGPPEYIPETASPTIIEKGGKYTAMPPSYMRSKAEAGAAACNLVALRKHVRHLKKYAMANGYDTSLALVADMQVKSGQARFFLVNLANDSILKKGLVAHGKGAELFTFNRRFSNDEGSRCTSLGMYKIGKAYNGSFGLSYKLYGLEKSNSNAAKRFVVLHSMNGIPDSETTWPIIQSEGCPAVAPAFLAELAPVLDNSARPMLLYIYADGAR
ncbi:MAG: murein L,D-transpeptidase catalytic domain family protein [Bacteroidota bacterium]|nr:murein L,D-transpeptidase catalytic domain family protein [Bacteroidota bacterium]